MTLRLLNLRSSEIIQRPTLLAWELCLRNIQGAVAIVLLRVLAAWWWRAAMDCPIIDMATFRVLWKGFVGRVGVGGNDVLKIKVSVECPEHSK